MKVAAKPRFKETSTRSSARKDEPECKNCKAFRNKPGYCKLHNEFKARRATCSEFGRKT